jgi:hypothetical protein
VLSFVTPSDSGSKESSGDKLCNEILALTDEKNELEKQMDTFNLYREQLAPWGEFAKELLAELREEGMFIFLEIVIDFFEHDKPFINSLLF